MRRVVEGLGLVVVVMAAAISPSPAAAEPEDTQAFGSCQENTNRLCGRTYKTFYISQQDPNHPITLDVYMPPAGNTYPAVILIHGGGWDSGSKRSDFLMQRAEFFRDQGLVAITIDYRLTCNPQDALASVADTGLCRGSGHGTPGTSGLEVLEDAQEAVVHVRNNAATYRIDPPPRVSGPSASARAA